MSFALCLMTLSSGCVPSGSAASKAPIPALRASDAAPCVDPGVDRDAIVSLAKTRLALASCRRTKQNVVDQYNDVRVTFGQIGEPQ